MLRSCRIRCGNLVHLVIRESPICFIISGCSSLVFLESWRWWGKVEKTKMIHMLECLGKQKNKIKRFYSNCVWIIFNKFKDLLNQTHHRCLCQHHCHPKIQIWRKLPVWRITVISRIMLYPSCYAHNICTCCH